MQEEPAAHVTLQDSRQLPSQFASVSQVKFALFGSSMAQSPPAAHVQLLPAHAQDSPGHGEGPPGPQAVPRTQAVPSRSGKASIQVRKGFVMPPV